MHKIWKQEKAPKAKLKQWVISTHETHVQSSVDVPGTCDSYSTNTLHDFFSEYGGNKFYYN